MFFKCSHEGCDRTFLSKKSMKEHMRTHSDNRPFTWYVIFTLSISFLYGECLGESFRQQSPNNLTFFCKALLISINRVFYFVYSD